MTRRASLPSLKKYLLNSTPATSALSCSGTSSAGDGDDDDDGRESSRSNSAAVSSCVSCTARQRCNCTRRAARLRCTPSKPSKSQRTGSRESKEMLRFVSFEMADSNADTDELLCLRGISASSGTTIGDDEDDVFIATDDDDDDAFRLLNKDFLYS